MARGEIWYVDLPSPQVGSGREQAGQRPAVIVLDDHSASPLSVIIPMTSQMTASRFPHTLAVKPSRQNGLASDSILLVFQIRALDKKRLMNRIGVLEAEYIAQLNEELDRLLGLG